MRTPTDQEDLEQELFFFRLYAAKGGEIAVFATSIAKWEPGELLTLPDGRRFEIVRVSVVAGSDIDGMFNVDQIE
jgi:hypothetical protein